MNAAEVEPVQTVYANADKQVVARILVVDDNKSIRFLLRNVLEPEGFEVVEAENGSDGLLRYQVEPTDLVITDMQMPVMGGLAMMRELQRTFPYVKVLAMSGSSSSLQRARPLTPYTLEKPFSLDAVRTTVAGALQEGIGDRAP